ncbi:putative glutathione S-transferase [Hypoxylon crocopeplum]|nr:putative glutathione S-transferase [Hypoxylon crocopeplum]
MSDQEIVFFDLPSRPPKKAWSYNPWKTRFVLNFKGIPYKTEFIEYPEIKPRFQDHFPKDTEEFTVPTIILPDGTWVMDSWKIAEVLEEKYPEPSILLDSPYLKKLRGVLSQVMEPLTAIKVCNVYNNILSEASQPYFRRTREEDIGKTFEKLAEEQSDEAAWKASEPYFHQVTAFLQENPEGPFFEGKTPGFADFVWAGNLIFFIRMGGNVFADALKASGDADTHLKLLEGLKPWSERDDY